MYSLLLFVRPCHFVLFAQAVWYWWKPQLMNRQPQNIASPLIQEIVNSKVCVILVTCDLIELNSWGECSTNNNVVYHNLPKTTCDKSANATCLK